MPELTSRTPSSSGEASRRLDDPREPAVAVADDAPVRAGIRGLEREDGRRGAGVAMRLDERADRLGPQRRDVAVEDEHVAARSPRARRARSERRRRCRAAPPARRPRRRRELARLRRGDDDDPLDAAGARRLDDPVDHPPAEQRVEVLRRRALHARADSGGHHDCCERRLPCIRKRWLGRQDSNLGSRDQNPLPYHLATPQGHGSLAAVVEEKGESEDGEDDEPENHAAT